jgi:Golgi SNAP receptor complex protein 2
MISEVLPEEKRRLNELELDFAELERGNPRANAVDVKMGLDEMRTRLIELERLVNNEPKSRRDEFRRRVLHLRTSHGHLNNSFESFTRRTGIQGLRSNLFSGAVRPDVNDNINYDLEMAESGSLDRSNAMVKSYIEQGQETLQELMEQRDRMKGVKKKVMDIANYLGLSNAIMKAVGDREKVDAIITYGAMAFLVILSLFILYIR